MGPSYDFMMDRKTDGQHFVIWPIRLGWLRVNFMCFISILELFCLALVCIYFIFMLNHFNAVFSF